MMRSILKPLSLMLALALFSFPAIAEQAAAPEIGKPAPAFTLTDIDGKSHSLADFAGKTVVLEWTNHECPYVIKHYDTQNMQSLQEQATADGVIWLSIVSSAPGKQGHTSAAEAQKIIEQQGIKATARLIDDTGAVGRLYNARTTPHMFVINPEGVLAYMGAIDDNSSARQDTVAGATNYVKLALEAVKQGKTPETAQTNPYGCSVKYDSI